MALFDLPSRCVAPFVPTPHDAILAALRLAGLGAEDLLLDLGSGDGRVVLCAAESFGATAVGVEIEPALLAQSRAAARASPAQDRVRFDDADLAECDLRPATVVYAFLSPQMAAALKPRLLAELQSGARVLSRQFPIPGWRAIAVDDTGSSATRTYLYRLPASTTR